MPREETNDDAQLQRSEQEERETCARCASGQKAQRFVIGKSQGLAGEHGGQGVRDEGGRDDFMWLVLPDLLCDA